MGEIAFRTNPCGIGCCHFHVCVEVFRRVLRNMASDNCRSETLPKSPWQCTNCLAVNDVDIDIEQNQSHDRFGITIERHTADKLGIEVEITESAVNIEDIGAGLINAHNLLNPHQAVQVGDSV